MQVGEKLVQFLQPVFDQMMHFIAGGRDAVLNFEQGRDVFECEPGRFRGADKLEPEDRVGPEDTVVTFRAALRTKDSRPFIISNCRNGHPGFTGKFSYGVRLIHDL